MGWPAIPGVRLELHCKPGAELGAVARFLRAHGVTLVNIPNKRDSDDLEGMVKQLHAAHPGVSQCVHFSCKNRWSGSPEAGIQRLQRLANCLAMHSPQPVSRPASEAGAPASKRLKVLQQAEPSSVLLVSGGGKKRKTFDTLSVLRALREPLPVPLFCAFNPFLPHPADLATEKQRLAAKLQTGLVDGMYLQIGTDLEALRAGIHHLRSCVEQAGMAWGAAGEAQAAGGSTARRTCRVYGSVLVPSKRLLAQMKFRPWTGVFLSQEYLSCVEAADAITVQILAVYAENGVIPLVETAVANELELARCAELLSAYSVT